MASFCVVSEERIANYTWQYSDDQGESWTSVNNNKPGYSLQLTKAKNGRLVRCILSDDKGNTEISESAVMVIVSDSTPSIELRIVSQPRDYVGQDKEMAYITVSTVGVSQSYQWLYSDDNGVSWTSVSNNSAMYSAQLTQAKNGRMVKCIITDSIGNSVTSGIAYLRIAQ